MASARKVAPSKLAASKVGQLICDRYHIIKKIGSGSFGEIYCAEDTSNGEKMAMKFESVNCSFLQLPIEYRFYKLISGEVGFPRCIAYEKTETDVILAIELLNKNLKELFELCNKVFSLKTILYIAIQSITRIETIHNKKFVYRDVKPDNFMIGFQSTNKSKIIHVIDFGLVKEYINPRTQKHIPMRDGKPVTGTARYMSCNAHFSLELSRRDDLESLAYMFLFFLKGSLPWSGMIKYSTCNNPVEQCQKIGSMKQAFRPEDLFEGFPQEFADYLNYVRNLEFEQTPDYEFLRSKFTSLFAKLNLEDDGVFDWDKLLTDK